MTTKTRQRLDLAVVEAGLAPTRHKAQALIRAGQVLVDDTPRDKPGTVIPGGAAIRLRGVPCPFVSRGGIKLRAALDGFGVDVTGRIAADLGASTGGFTDCLLQGGASQVYAIDVGYGQLAWKLRQDPRVVVMERTNVRHLDSLPVPVPLIVGDLSFISLIKVLPAIKRLAAPQANIILLIKPQFEAGRGQIGRGGVVRDEAVRAQAISHVLAGCEALGFTVVADLPSPIRGAKKGNIEHLVHLRAPDSTESPA